MSRVIRISDRTFQKLQMLVEQPFEDTPDSVVERLADQVLSKRGITSPLNAASQAGQAIELDSDAPANLAFTRLRYASLDGRVIRNPKWNKLLQLSHVLALKKLGSFEALLRATGAHIRKGRYEESGFRYVPEGDFSIQGQDANLAWQNSLRLARELGAPIEVELEWLNRSKAAHPGQRGCMVWQPERSGLTEEDDEGVFDF